MKSAGKLKLLIFNDYFYPAYKAGGPIQSLVNLISHLDTIYDIYVISSAYDLNEKLPIENIDIGKWVDITLPGNNSKVKVWYVGKNENIKATIKKAVKEIKPSIVYINGMFTYNYVILPLLVIRNVKIVICPRGMIQEGALSGKYLKKKIYLTALRLSGLVKNVWWHATTEVERDDAKKLFGNNINVVVAGNIPKRPVELVDYPDKQSGKLRLVYISLITAKKNLLQAIEAINLSSLDITLDIYGPVKDVSYWEKCELAIKKSKGKINYKGTVIPERVQSTFKNYDAGYFLTKAENFGHALYESLSAGRPIITSYFTPWENLESKLAGWNADIENMDDIISILEKAVMVDNSHFKIFCDGAHKIAKEYFSEGFELNDYKKLF